VYIYKWAKRVLVGLYVSLLIILLQVWSVTVASTLSIHLKYVFKFTKQCHQ
jgi:hypothetical protein